MPSHEKLIGHLNFELARARGNFANFNSTHEGYAVIKEEVDELWEAVKTKGTSREHLAKEALQIAAMAIRFIEDLVPETIDGHIRL